MAKYVPDTQMDAGLAGTDACDKMTLCEGQPASFAEATTAKGAGGKMLAEVAMVAGDIVIADDTSGRKATMAAKNGVSVGVSGDADHIALVVTGTSTLGPVTTCTSQAVTAGNTVNIGSWKHNIPDPT